MTDRLILLLALLALIGNLALFSTLCLKGLWRSMPVFTTISGYEAIRAVFLFTMLKAHNDHAYFVAYWSSETVAVALQLALLWEIVFRVTTSEPGLRSSTVKLYISRRYLAIAFLFAGFLALIVPAPHSMASIVDMRVTLFTSLLTCEVFFLVVRRANRLALSLPPHILAITNGITVWAVIAVLSSLIQVFRGWEKDENLLDILRAISVVAMLVYWTAHFWRSALAKLRSALAERYSVVSNTLLHH